MEDSFKELKRRISTTANNRFNASSRLKRHNQLALSTVILFSLGLILFSLTSTLGIPTHSSSTLLNASTIFFSVAILTISTALSMSDFSLRSERHHDCGRELNALSLELERFSNNQAMRTSDEYEKYQKQYEQVLSKYENHKTIDHLFTKLSWSEQYESKWYRPVFAYAGLFREYIVYILLIFVEIIWLGIIYTPLAQSICH